MLVLETCRTKSRTWGTGGWRRNSAGDGEFAGSGLFVGCYRGIGNLSIFIEVVGGVAVGAVEVPNTRSVLGRRLAPAVEASQIPGPVKTRHADLGVCDGGKRVIACAAQTILAIGWARERRGKRDFKKRL